MGHVTQTVDVRHELIAKAKILHEDWFGLPPVGPDLVLRTASMAAEVGLKGSVFEPSDVELGIVVVVTDVFAGIGWVDEWGVLRRVMRGKITASRRCLYSSKGVPDATKLMPVGI